MIKVTEDLFLKNFDINEDSWVLEEIKTTSNSKMIHDVESRLRLSHKSDEIEFNNAYLVVYNNEVVGYVYISAKNMGAFYFENLMFKKYRGQGLGSYILDEVTDKIMFDNPDIKECRLSIHRSNTTSMKVANKNYFYEEEDDYSKDTIDFIKDNPYHLNKRR